MLALIFYRKLQLRFLGHEANKRLSEVEELCWVVGSVFHKSTFLFSGTRYCTLSNMGHDCDEHGNRVSGMCWNSPIGISVYLADEVCMGLGVELHGRVLSIRQMQGVHGRPIGKVLPNWPELFVKACMWYAARAKLREVRIYKADQDLGFRYPVLDVPAGANYAETMIAHRNRLRRRYDRTAQKLKFAKKKRYYVWSPPPQAGVTSCNS